MLFFLAVRGMVAADCSDVAVADGLPECVHIVGGAQRWHDQTIGPATSEVPHGQNEVMGCDFCGQNAARHAAPHLGNNSG